MEQFKEYLTPIIRWWWLVVAATLLATGSAYWFVRDLPPTYQARTTLVAGNALTDPTGGQIGRDQQLAAMYMAIATQDITRNAAQTALRMDWFPDYRVRLVGNGVFIEVSVVDTDARRAQLVANELARQVILRSPSTMGSAEAERQVFVSHQLDILQADIQQTQADIATKQDALGQATSAVEINDLQAQLDALQAKFTTLQTTYGNLLASTPTSVSNTISIFESAALPQTPIGPNKKLLLLVAALSGLVLSAAAAYLIEYLDDTLKTSKEVSPLFQMPIIGYVPRMERGAAKGLYMVTHPHSPPAEAFRSVRTNLEFASTERPLRTILVTSVGAGEGKTTTATNLALALAQSGKQVVLLDGDLRWPNAHRRFGMSNEIGLTDVVHGELSLQDAMQKSVEGDLMVIPTGTPPPNPAELLSSKKMEHVLASLQELAEVVVVDGPPFIVADAWILAAKVDGVVLVVEVGRTSRRAAREMMEQLKQSRTRILGIVINRMRRRSGSYYGSYLSGSAAGTPKKARPAAAPKSEHAAGERKPWAGFLRGRSSASSVSHDLPEEPKFGNIALKAEKASAGRTRDALDLFLTIGRTLSAPAHLPELLQRLLQLSLEGVGASSGSMVVLDESGCMTAGALAYAGKVYAPTPQQLEDTVEHGLAGWVIENKEAVLVASTRDDPRWLARDWDHQNNASRSVISVPLSVDSRVFGALTLVHPRAGQFTDDDLTLLKAIGMCMAFNPEAISPPSMPVLADAETSAARGGAAQAVETVSAALKTASAVEKAPAGSQLPQAAEARDAKVVRPEEVAEVPSPEVIAEVPSPEVIAEVASPEVVVEVASSEVIAEVASPEVVTEVPRPEVVVEATSSQAFAEATRTEVVAEVISPEVIVEVEADILAGAAEAAVRARQADGGAATVLETVSVSATPEARPAANMLPAQGQQPPSKTYAGHSGKNSRKKGHHR